MKKTNDSQPKQKPPDGPGGFLCHKYYDLDFAWQAAKALSYLDYTTFWNGIKHIVRHPAREMVDYLA